MKLSSVFNFCTTSFCLLLVLIQVQNGFSQSELTILQIGDSVGNNARNRIAADTVFLDAGITTTWVGDHGYPPTFARGGITYEVMLNGSSALNTVGLTDIILGIDDGTYATPDILYLLGGYNNAFFEPANSPMTLSLSHLQQILDLATLELPDTKIFVSNITTLVGQSEHRSSNGLALNSLIAAEVAGRSNVYLVDNYSIIGVDDLRPDGLHPNDITGQQKIGVNFANTVLAIPEPGTAGVACLLLLAMVHLNRRKPVENG